jgi:hypothetical protein
MTSRVRLQNVSTRSGDLRGFRMNWMDATRVPVY